jgi:hypothetical protein
MTPSTDQQSTAIPTTHPNTSLCMSEMLASDSTTPRVLYYTISAARGYAAGSLLGASAVAALIGACPVSTLCTSSDGVMGSHE